MEREIRDFFGSRVMGLGVLRQPAMHTRMLARMLISRGCTRNAVVGPFRHHVRMEKNTRFWFNNDAICTI